MFFSFCRLLRQLVLCRSQTAEMASSDPSRLLLLRAAAARTQPRLRLRSLRSACADPAHRRLCSLSLSCAQPSLLSSPLLSSAVVMSFSLLARRAAVQVARPAARAFHASAPRKDFGWSHTQGTTRQQHSAERTQPQTRHTNGDARCTATMQRAAREPCDSTQQRP